MRIQEVTTNTNSNLSFKASFVNDKNGYFRQLWYKACKDDEFCNLVDTFSKTEPDHKLEIVQVSADNGTYNIFNHKNGIRTCCTTSHNPSSQLKEIIQDLLNSQKYIFVEASPEAIAYQKLTGQYRCR